LSHYTAGSSNASSFRHCFQQGVSCQTILFPASQWNTWSNRCVSE